MHAEPTNKRFLLIGIGGVYNYGCEAIVRGTTALLRQQWPESKVFYATPRRDQDAKQLADIDVEVIPREQIGRYSLPSIANKLSRMMGYSAYVRRDKLRMAHSVDAVLSIGGDLYTIYASGNYPGSLIKYGDAVLANGKPYVLWGSSIGPFSARPDVERLVTRHLKRTTLITVRDVSTLEYLDSLGIQANVVPTADPAFAVAPEIKTSPQGPEKTKIAINLSPLSIRYTKQTRDEAVNQSATAIEKIVERLNCDILLTPHVVLKSMPTDDDLAFLAEIQRQLSASTQSRTERLPGEAGFIETKRQLSNCSAVVAARMHCAISAMSAAVPTLLLAYSKKAIGMGKYVYRSEEHVQPVNNFGDEHFLDGLTDMIDNRSQISRFLLERSEQIRADADRAVTQLAATLG
ncbi:MAG: polysaccharide pyruvyl transferase family protein [Pirellulaceae bacterium]|nr:polysaccharide pyruvyl transferase family protein [Pirellulaceae bacterium]